MTGQDEADGRQGGVAPARDGAGPSGGDGALGGDGGLGGDSSLGGDGRPGGDGSLSSDGRPGGDRISGGAGVRGASGGVVGEAEAWERLLGIRSDADADADAGDAGLSPSAEGRTVLRHGRTGADAAADELAERYLSLCLAGPRFVLAQLGQSLDGFIASRTGDADFVTGEEDRTHLHRLRALCDAVLVGAGTAVSDDPRLTVRACAGASPVRVVLDPHRRVPAGRRVFTDGEARTLWVVGPGSGPDDDADRGAGVGAGTEVLTLPDSAAFAPRRLLHELARRGLGRVLVEGGGVTVSRFLDAGALDRLYVTVAPVLLGDGVPGIRFPGPGVMRDALRPPTRRFTLGEDVLFELDLGSGQSAGTTPTVGDEDGRSWQGGGEGE